MAEKLDADDVVFLIGLGSMLLGIGYLTGVGGFLICFGIVTILAAVLHSFKKDRAKKME